MIRKGDDCIDRRANQVGDAPDIAGGDKLEILRGVGAANGNLLVSIDVGDGDEMLAVRAIA